MNSLEIGIYGLGMLGVGILVFFIVGITREAIKKIKEKLK